MAHREQGWSRWYDDAPDHPKFLAAGHKGGWLYVCGQAYASKHGTDGKIPKAVVPRLSDVPTPTKVAATLVAVGLWHDEGDHYQQHDYEEMQSTAAEREEKRKQARERQRKSREKKADVTPDVTPPVTRDTPVTSRVTHASVTLAEGEVEGEVEQGQELDGAADAPHDWPRVHGDTPLTDRIVSWARSHGHVRQVETRADVTRWCLDLAADQLGDTNRFVGAATQLVVEWVERMCGEALQLAARKHLVRLLNAEGPRLTFTAMEAAVVGGAGLSEEYADDPQALVRYARSCIGRWRAEGQGRAS